MLRCFLLVAIHLTVNPNGFNGSPLTTFKIEEWGRKPDILVESKLIFSSVIAPTRLF